MAIAVVLQVIGMAAASSMRSRRAGCTRAIAVASGTSQAVAIESYLTNVGTGHWQQIGAYRNMQ